MKDGLKHIVGKRREEAPNHVDAPETLEGLMTRDLAAWRETRALIDRTKRN